jgi:hypothetical protein
MFDKGTAFSFLDKVEYSFLHAFSRVTDMMLLSDSDT